MFFFFVISIMNALQIFFKFHLMKKKKIIVLEQNNKYTTISSI